MRGILDTERLEGAHETRVVLRPGRVAIPVDRERPDQFLVEIEQRCATWGGAGSPLVPASSDGQIDPVYAKAIPGAAIDGVRGLIHPWEMFRLPQARVSFPDVRDSFGDQLAVGLLKYRKQKSPAYGGCVAASDGDQRVDRRDLWSTRGG